MRTCSLVTVLLATLGAASVDATALDNEGSHKALKLSPKDKTSRGDGSLDATDKFQAPKKAPVGTPEDQVMPVGDGDNRKGSVLLDDYDPTRLGVSAAEAEAEKGKYDNTPASPQSSGKPVAATNDDNPAAKAKGELASGKGGGGTGGVGATAGTGSGPAIDPNAEMTPRDKTHTSESPTIATEKTNTNLEHSMSRMFGVTMMIVMSEIFDKTFFIAALMAMRNSPLFVFSASFASLGLMHTLSTFLGMVLPQVLSPKVTMLLAALLFFVFGLKLLKDAWDMNPREAASEEMREVEQEIELRESNRATERAETQSHETSRFAGITNLLSLVFSPLWIQIFVMNFLAEWGDRSQIATIALGASTHYIDVLIGGLLGHGLCTAFAIAGGRLLASSLSTRTITFGGAFCFLLFACIYFVDWKREV